MTNKQPMCKGGQGRSDTDVVTMGEYFLAMGVAALVALILGGIVRAALAFFG